MAARAPFAFKLSLVGICLLIYILETRKDVFADAVELSDDDEGFLLTSRSFRKSIRKDVASLREDLTSLEKAVGGLRSDFEKFQKLSKTPRVSFFARVLNSITNLTPWAPIVFSDLVTNEGGAYNKINGVFKAPIAGTYVFYSNILAAEGGSIETYLKVNGKIAMELYSGSHFRGSGSNMAVLQLKVGDTVNMAKHGPWGSKPNFVYTRWSTFSGYLLYAD